MASSRRDSEAAAAPSEQKLFAGVKFHLSGFDRAEESEFIDMLEQHGGVNVGHYSPACTHIVVSQHTYDDPVCAAARKDGKALVTKSWVKDCLNQHALTDTSSVLYMPVRDPSGIPGGKNLCICLTGYQGLVRGEIERMVSMMGAAFFKPLVASRVTHLICYKFEGSKYNLAKQLGLKLVNHRWLEDCLRSWSLVDEKDYAISGWDLERAEAKDSEDDSPDLPEIISDKKTELNLVKTTAAKDESQILEKQEEKKEGSEKACVNKQESSENKGCSEKEEKKHESPSKKQSSPLNEQKDEASFDSEATTQNYEEDDDPEVEILKSLPQDDAELRDDITAGLSPDKSFDKREGKESPCASSKKRKSLSDSKRPGYENDDQQQPDAATLSKKGRSDASDGCQSPLHSSIKSFEKTAHGIELRRNAEGESKHTAADKLTFAPQAIEAVEAEDAQAVSMSKDAMDVDNARADNGMNDDGVQVGEEVRKTPGSSKKRITADKQDIQDIIVIDDRDANSGKQSTEAANRTGNNPKKNGRKGKKVSKAEDAKLSNGTGHKKKYRGSTSKRRESQKTNGKAKSRARCALEDNIKKLNDRWFALSGHSQEKKKYARIVRKLQGHVCRDDHIWKDQTTHCVMAAPLRRTEKLFAALASGRWVLKDEYLQASEKAGKFVEEERFEWYASGMNEEKTIDLEAPRKWRLSKQQSGCGAFEGLRILIYGECILPPLGTLERAIKAGGGFVLATTPPYAHHLARGVDFAIIADGVPEDDPRVAEILKHNVACVRDEFFVEFVCKPSSRSPDKYVAFNTKPAVEQALAKLENKKTAKLQSEGDSESEGDEAEDEEEGNWYKDDACVVCGLREDWPVMLLCDGCDDAFHIYCLDPKLPEVPKEDWFCRKCCSKEQCL